MTPPRWIEAIPAGEFRGRDGRGPWRMRDPDAVLRATRQLLPLFVDECAAATLGAPIAQLSPARGWIMDLALRNGSLWGRVEWTKDGAWLVTDRAYRSIAPCFDADAGGNILRLRHVSLTNLTNLPQLAKLDAIAPDIEVHLMSARISDLQAEVTAFLLDCRR